MPISRGGGTLTDTQKKRFQRRLSHYFKDHKYRNGVDSKKIAKQLGYDSITRFYGLESENIPFPKFINALDFLASLANIDNMRVGEFVSYLEGDVERFKGDQPADLGRNLHEWERTIIEAFDAISMLVRKDFIELCKEVEKDGKKKLQVLLQIVNILKNKDVKALESLRDGLQAF